MSMRRTSRALWRGYFFFSDGFGGYTFRGIVASLIDVRDVKYARSLADDLGGADEPPAVAEHA